jgi:hypothetical protein
MTKSNKTKQNMGGVHFKDLPSMESEKPIIDLNYRDDYGYSATHQNSERQDVEHHGYGRTDSMDDAQDLRENQE